MTRAFIRGFIDPNKINIVSPSICHVEQNWFLVPSISRSDCTGLLFLCTFGAFTSLARISGGAREIITNENYVVLVVTMSFPVTTGIEYCFLVDRVSV